METEFFHLCPVCGNKVFHKNQNSLVDFNRRLKKGKTKGLCRHCVTQDENWVSQHAILQKGHFARSNYDIWLEKYGQEEADRRLSEFISKQKLVYSSKTDEEKKKIDEFEKGLDKLDTIEEKLDYTLDAILKEILGR